MLKDKTDSNRQLFGKTCLYDQCTATGMLCTFFGAIKLRALA